MHARTFLAAITLAALTAGAAGADSPWSWQNPQPQGNRLYDVVAVDSLRYIAVGHSGTIIETQDGGASWSVRTLAAGITAAITGIAFSPALPGPSSASALGAFDKHMIVDEDGGISLKTDDDFDPVENSPFGLRSVARDAVDPDKWVAVGDSAKVYVSTDCGETWEDRSVPGIGSTLTSVHVRDDAIYVGTGAGAIHRSLDCGLNWTSVAAQPGTRHGSTGAAGPAGTLLTSVNAIHFVDATHGKVVGDFGGIAGTSDGGVTWTVETAPTTLALDDVTALDVNTWIAVGNVGIVLRTTDAGATWSPIPSGTGRRLEGVANAGNTVVAVGEQGAILKSTDGGQTYQMLAAGVLAKHFYRACYLDDMRGIVVGETGTILKTINGGNTWAEIASGTNRSLYGLAREPQSLSAGTAAGAGEVLYTVGLTGKIMRSDDAGDTWVSQTSGTTRRLTDVASPASGVAYVCGDNGTILKTVDGGASWSLQTSGTVANLTDLAFANDQTGWVVGAGGVILKTVNGGTSWAPQASGTTQNLTGVDFIDASTGTAVGWNGTMLRTSDGGQTWAPVAGGAGFLYAVAFMDGATGMSVGSAGAFLTTDGGQTWTPEAIGAGHTLYGVALTPDGGSGFRATAVGVFSAIIARTFSGTVSAGPLPRTAGVQLRPNAPNPFASITTIRYDLPREAFVMLEVFDPAGRRVGRPFAGRQPAGRHGIAFDGSSLANGVYYYRLTAGEARRAGRMVLSR